MEVSERIQEMKIRRRRKLKKDIRSQFQSQNDSAKNRRLPKIVRQRENLKRMAGDKTPMALSQIRPKQNQPHHLKRKMSQMMLSTRRVGTLKILRKKRIKS